MVKRGTGSAGGGRKKVLASLKGDVFMLGDKHQSLTTNQVQLLTAIGEGGSISGAARQVGISYKTAWDRINAMNNLAEQPLVVRSAGGARGGGTKLTDYGKRVVEGFLALTEAHDEFLQRIGGKLQSFGDVANFMRVGAMTSSARNQYRGVVARVRPGAVNAEVELRISAKQILVATITRDSVKELGLKKGAAAIALVNASSIILSTDVSIVTSARNKLPGVVSRVNVGAVNSDITMDLGDGKSLSATVTNRSALELGLRKGTVVCALFKASSVILQVE